MKKLILLLTLFSFSLAAQDTIDNLFTDQKSNFENITSEFIKELPSAKLLQIDLTKVNQLNSNPNSYIISIPTKENGTISIELTPFKITTEDFKVLTPEGEQKVDLPTFYKGKIIGEAMSFVSLTATDQSIEGMIISKEYNLTLGKIKNDKTNTHIIYSTEDIPNNTPFEESEAPIIKNIEEATKNTNQRNLAATCTPLVRIFLEADYQMYTDWGNNVSTVVSQMTSIFNQVAILYSNESVNIALSGIYVWTSTDPYASATNTSTSLNLLTSYWNNLGNNFNGDIVHMVSTKSLGGGIAYYYSNSTPVYQGMTSRAVFSSCSKSVAKGLSANINNSVSNVPTYSWNVEVIAHELGHNFGLPHTQSCTWPNGALDDCYTTEGGCASGPTPTNGGTIMSYCHLSSTGINFLNGFGTEPGDKMRAEVAAATCLGSTTPATPTVTDISRNCPGPVTLTAAGCSGTYNWYTSSQSTSSVYTGNPYSIANIPASATYYVTCTDAGSCETGKVPLNVEVVLLTDVVTVTPASRCNEGTLNLSAAGCTYTYNWYDSKTGTSILGTGSTFTTPYLSTTTTYYVDCNNGSCSIEERIPVTATISTLNSLICDASDLTGTVGDASFNLGLTETTGQIMTGNRKTYSTSGLSSYPVVNYTDNTNTTCQSSSWGNSNAVLVPFTVSETGSYTLSTSGEGYTTFSIFSSTTFNCSNFVGSNSWSAISWFGNKTITLNECTTYYALLYDINNTNTSIEFSIQGSGDILEIIPPSTGNNYTYIAVNNSTGLIESLSATSDFSSLSAGTFNVYGINYQPSFTPSTLIGLTIAQAKASGCLMLSSNTKLLTISCPSLGFNLVSPTDDLSSGTNNFKTDLEIEATNKLTGTSNTKYDSGSYILLNPGFSAISGTVFEAFIDGCE